MDEILLVVDENDITEYKEAELVVAQNFVNGLITLGELLSRKRNKYFPNNQWSIYLKSIGKSLFFASQLIRLFEYSKNNLKLLLDSNITNWTKLNSFLILPDAAKEELGESIHGDDIQSKEFVEKVKSVKKKHQEIENEKMKDEDEVENENIGEHVDTVVEDVNLTPDSLNLEEIVNNTGSTDTNFMAKHVLAECNESGDTKFSNHCMPFVVTVLEIEKLFQYVSKNNMEKKLSLPERDYWKIQVKSQIRKLTDILDTI